MTYVTHGLPASGQTPHFQLSYDDASPADGRDATASLQTMCGEDYELMSRWFRGVSIEPVDLGVSTATAGSGPALPGGIAIFPGPAASPGRLRYLFVAEVLKLFMRAQAGSWLDVDGGGQGLSLARFLGANALAVGAMGAPELDLQPANAWMQSAREDFVNGPGDGEAPDGCRVLFLYYLEMQLKYAVEQIVGTGGPTVAGAYRALTHKAEDPFPEFKALLEGRFPGTATIPDHPDNPWPIGHLADDLIDEEELPIIDWGHGGLMRP